MDKNYDFLIAGAGISGITIAERLASAGKKVLVIDKRNHLGGNCYDYEKNGIVVQKYGPHIFHTKEKKVFQYLSKFTKWNSYGHKVLAEHKGQLFPMPVNRETINKLFNVNLKNEGETRAFLKTKKSKIKKIKSSKDFILAEFGKEIYQAFFENYTKKQWGLFPEQLDKSVVGRLPVKYNDDPFYFNDSYQGLPLPSYSAMFSNMLKNINIEIRLNADFYKVKEEIGYKKLIFTGEIDKFFNYRHGNLGYRCIDFRFQKLPINSYQENSVINYTDSDVDFTRITEFKKFYPIKNKGTIICKEYPGWQGEPSYPVQSNENFKILKKYLQEEKKFKNIYFLGRLAKFKYLNMDSAVLEALELGDRIN